MSVFNLKTAGLALVAGVSLAGCAYGPYGGLGVGVGYGNSNGYYDPYYGGGYYGAGYGSPYGYGYGSPYGYGYGMPGYGWYDGYYYPGSGYYVYDQYRNPRRWSDAERRYWEWRQQGAPRSTSRGTAGIIQNWADFNNGQPTTTTNNVVRQRSVTMNTGANHTFTEPVVRNQRVQTQQRQRTVSTEVRSDRGNRGNRGGHNRHVDSE